MRTYTMDLIIIILQQSSSFSSHECFSVLIRYSELLLLFSQVLTRYQAYLIKISSSSRVLLVVGMTSTLRFGDVLNRGFHRPRARKKTADRTRVSHVVTSELIRPRHTRYLYSVYARNRSHESDQRSYLNNAINTHADKLAKVSSGRALALIIRRPNEIAIIALSAVTIAAHLEPFF